jgi:hypothetical protein
MVKLEVQNAAKMSQKPSNLDEHFNQGGYLGNGNSAFESESESESLPQVSYDC